MKCAICGSCDNFTHMVITNDDCFHRYCMTDSEMEDHDLYAYGRCAGCDKVVHGQCAQFGPNGNKHTGCCSPHDIEKVYGICARCDKAELGNYADCGPKKDSHFFCVFQIIDPRYQ
jgi:hypothetical protein